MIQRGMAPRSVGYYPQCGWFHGLWALIQEGMVPWSMGL